MKQKYATLKYVDNKLELNKSFNILQNLYVNIGSYLNYLPSNNGFLKIDDSQKICNNLVNTQDLENESITTIKLGSSSVTTNKLYDSAVTTKKIDKLAVTTEKIDDSSVTTNKLGDSAVTTVKINDSAVTTVKINDSAVTTNKLSDSAVTTNKLGNSAVTTNKLSDSAVTTNKLGDSAVTTVKINDSAVTTNKLGDSAVTTVKINDSAVTTNKLNNSAVTSEKIAPNINISIDSYSFNKENIKFSYVENDDEMLTNGNFILNKNTINECNLSPTQIIGNVLHIYNNTFNSVTIKSGTCLMYNLILCSSDGNMEVVISPYHSYIFIYFDNKWCLKF
jgi:hypothetical protein